MSTQNTHRIFVYGSLRKGLGLHRVIEDSTFIGTFTTLPKYTLLDLGPFPGLLATGTTAVVGEIYEVDNLTLQQLDKIEGSYDRLPIDLDDGTKVDAYILRYRSQRSTAVVVGGDWVVEYRNKEKQAAKSKDPRSVFAFR